MSWWPLSETPSLGIQWSQESWPAEYVYTFDPTHEIVQPPADGSAVGCAGWSDNDPTYYLLASGSADYPLANWIPLQDMNGRAVAFVFEWDASPSNGGGDIAISNLATAGLARVGFGPDNTDTVTLPVATDPPEFLGGNYAFKVDDEGAE